MADASKAVELGQINQELESEHRALRALVERVRAGAVGGDAVTLLDELHGTLASHFAHEQYPGGFYETLGACQPAYRDDLRVLVDQHFNLVAQVNSLRERVKRAGTGDASALTGELTAIAEQLHQHEAREHSMVERLLAK